MKRQRPEEDHEEQGGQQNGESKCPHPCVSPHREQVVGLTAQITGSGVPAPLLVLAALAGGTSPLPALSLRVGFLPLNIEDQP